MTMLFLAVFLLGVCGALGEPCAPPGLVDVMEALEARAEAPSKKMSDAFSAKHAGTTFFLLVSQAQAVNKCLDLCDRGGTCPGGEDECEVASAFCGRPCSVGDDLECLPMGCSSFLGDVRVGDQKAGPVVVPRGSLMPFEWKKGRLEVCMQCMRRAWESSQLVADLVVACSEIGTYANASGILHSLYGDGGDVLLERYPNARRLLNTVSTIRSPDFCNLYSIKH